MNAFETPIRSSQGHALEAIRRLNAEYADLKETWGIEGTAKATIRKSLSEQLDKKSDAKTTDAKALNGVEVVSLDDLIKGMVAHVI